jgi:hypothetical protein
MRYADVSRREQKLQDVTSLTVKEFEKLVPVFEEEFQEYMKTHCLDGKERVGRGYVTYANCPLPTAEDRLLFILVYLKTNNLQVIHGELFKMSQGKANQWIHTLLPVMQATFGKLGDAPARSMQELARRLGQNVLRERSSLVTEEELAALHEHPVVPDNSSVALDVSQDVSSFAEMAPNGSSHDFGLVMQEENHAVGFPLFAMMGPKDGSNGQKMTKNRKNITVERKRLTR